MKIVTTGSLKTTILTTTTLYYYQDTQTHTHSLSIYPVETLYYLSGRYKTLYPQ